LGAGVGLGLGLRGGLGGALGLGYGIGSGIIGGGLGGSFVGVCLCNLGNGANHSRALEAFHCKVVKYALASLALIAYDQDLERLEDTVLV
jgi:hypothetical protein